MEILKDFGVEPLLLLAQIVNFAILLFVLKRFLYKPILKVLEERKKKVEASVEQAQEIEKRFEETSTKQEELLEKAKRESGKIIEEAKNEAKMLSEQLQRETAQQTEETLKRARETTRLEKLQIIEEAKEEIVDLVGVATEKVAAKSLSKLDKQRLVKEAVREVGK